MKSLLSILALAIISSANAQWTPEAIDDLKLVIRDYFDGDEARAPENLRLSFHDCVGGCDGCINFANAANGGLQTGVAASSSLYEDTIPFQGQTMSRADFYNLMGITAVEYSIDLNNRECPDQPECLTSMIELPFDMGRVDCPTSPYTTDMHDFPQPFWDHDQVISYWSDNFGMTQWETVALLGAHTLGGMEESGSGYHGNWKERAQFAFNNDYYKILLAPPGEMVWTHFDNTQGIPPKDGEEKKREPTEEESVKDSSERWQWRGKDQNGTLITYMLDVDMDLVADLDIIDDGGESTCDIGECAPSPSITYTEAYAADSDVWLEQFACAFIKLGANRPSRGQSALTRVSPGGPERDAVQTIGCPVKSRY